jgi:NADPH-dependent curcumin reductase CurA
MTMQAARIGEMLVALGGQFSAFIASGSSTTTIKRSAGRVCRISIITAGTAAFTIFDNTAGSGNVLYVSPATTSVGIIDLQIPAQLGITIVNVVSGPALGVSFD